MQVNPIRPEDMTGKFDAVAPRRDITPEASFKTLLQRAGSAIETKPAPHEVQGGESLWQICAKELACDGAKPSASEIHTAVQRVAEANGLADANLLRIGQKLDLSAIGGTPKPVAAVPAPLPELPATPLAKAAAEPAPVVPEAKAAAAEPVAARPPRITMTSLPAPPLVPHAREAKGGPELPVANKAVDVTALMQSILNEPPAGASTSDRPWGAILDGPARLTSAFGYRKDPFTGVNEHHNGIDIAAAHGSNIRPYKSGEVVFSGWQNGYGKTVVVRHPDGSEAVYGHASELLVNVGDAVTRTAVLGKVGSTGRSTGPHLHFELRSGGRAIDPVPLLQGRSVPNIAKAF